MSEFNKQNLLTEALAGAQDGQITHLQTDPSIFDSTRQQMVDALSGAAGKPYGINEIGDARDNRGIHLPALVAQKGDLVAMLVREGAGAVSLIKGKEAQTIDVQPGSVLLMASDTFSGSKNTVWAKMDSPTPVQVEYVVSAESNSNAYADSVRQNDLGARGRRSEAEHLRKAADRLAKRAKYAGNLVIKIDS